MITSRDSTATPSPSFLEGNNSLALLWEFFPTSLLLTKEAEEGCCTGTVPWMDVHTGLGPSGVDSTLFRGNFRTQDYLQGPSRTMVFRGPQLDEDARQVNKGYDKAKGFEPDFFSQLFLIAGNPTWAWCRNLAPSRFFWVGNALIVEDRAHQHLSPAEALEWSKLTVRPRGSFTNKRPNGDDK